MTIEDFAKNFLEDILALSQATDEGEYQENVFTENAYGYLVEIGECFDPEVAYYSARGAKLNAWEYNYDNDSLDLFVSIFDNSQSIGKITKGLINEAFKKCRHFLESSLAGNNAGLEESSRAYEVAQTIQETKNATQNIRIFLLTNCLASSEPVEDVRINGKLITHHVWDIERFFQVAGNFGRRESIEIDETMLNGGLPCVRLPDDNEIYESYVGMIPGGLLSALYGKWGQRLLEQNVRAYLQSRNKVNKGITQTITNYPHMFLAYNNGISTTAEAVKVEQDHTDGQLKIIRLTNFQIVNGGQTTASIYHASKKEKADLSKVHVQFKLTVLKDPKTLNEHVPLISRYANTQTKVNTSDFSANHPYHLELEKLSRSIWAPNKDLRGKSTNKWYYERSRGQYINDALMEATPAKISAFKVRYPKDQILTKTSVAKYEMSWRQYPQYVSQGAETNFVYFMELVVGRQNDLLPDETYFKRLVGKAILFNECDDIVRKKAFGGYKANVVTYSIALLSYLAEMQIDLDRIWEKQTISDDLKTGLSSIADIVWKHITNPPKEGMNISSYCKREGCWHSLRETDFDLSKIGLNLDEAKIRDNKKKTGVKIREELSPDEEAMIKKILEYPKNTWGRLSKWGAQTEALNSWERRFAYSIGTYLQKNKSISPKQAMHAQKILDFALEKGFKLEEKD